MWSTAAEPALAAAEPQPAAPAPVSLASLHRGQRARVVEVRLPQGIHGHDTNLVLRLLEIGFVPDERVRIVAHGPGGGEPLAVRVGGTMFALRRHEAEHILVQPL
ncbi:MAG: ferrous iron transport protein A [Xanthomonadales bacterium]|nr:hypothetical protein [Xanthomonadales bacterium]MCC6593516.1 ferrous iron transport protein A [Xanthomonadales bacterium]MCE7932359.1 ferrous iron transport protein A [Xanthomonadales bacterium PRO6]